MLDGSFGPAIGLRVVYSRCRRDGNCEVTMIRIVRKLGKSHGFLNNGHDGLFLIAIVHNGCGTRGAEELATSANCVTIMLTLVVTDRSKEGSRWVHTPNEHAEWIIA